MGINEKSERSRSRQRNSPRRLRAIGAGLAVGFFAVLVVGAGRDNSFTAGAASKPAYGDSGSGKPMALDMLGPGPLTESTFPHNDGRFAATGKSILIGEGRAPSGLRYEVAAYAADPPRPSKGSGGSARVTTCIDLDYPSLHQAPGTNKICFDGDSESVLHVSGLSEMSRSGEKVGYVLTGETQPRVANVSVTYMRRDGERAVASGSYGLITRKVARATGIQFRAGELIAFLPAGAIQPTDSPDPAASLVGSLRVTAYSSNGEILDRDTWGDR